MAVRNASLIIGSAGLFISVKQNDTAPGVRQKSGMWADAYHHPDNGGGMYAEAGALKYRGSSGTVTTLAVA